MKENKMKIISQNKKANYDYSLSEKIEVGIVLLGAEVKGILNNGINLKESYVKIINSQVFLIGANINCILPSWDKTDLSLRTRKLLLHKKQINKYLKLLKMPGTTLIITKCYIADNGKLKMECALGKGKKSYDKRNTIKERDLLRSC